MTEEETIPLFPLGIVLFPELPLPLHIFEERYKIMIKQCLEQKKEFGVVYGRDNQIHRVGCTATILRVLKRYEDGRMDILAQGTRKFEIKEIHDEKKYLQAQVTFVEDEIEHESEHLIILAKEGVDLLKKLDRLTINKYDLKFMEKLDIKIISYIISGIGGFTMKEKQKFLEMTSTAERLKHSVESLKNLVERVKMENYIQNLNRKDSNFRNFSNN